MVARIGQGNEPGLVEALVPQPAVEALGISVLNRLARCNEVEGDAPSVDPDIKGFTGKLEAVIADDPVGQAVAPRQAATPAERDHQAGGAAGTKSFRGGSGRAPIARRRHPVSEANAEGCPPRQLLLHGVQPVHQLLGDILSDHFIEALRKLGDHRHGGLTR